MMGVQVLVFQTDDVGGTRSICVFIWTKMAVTVENQSELGWSKNLSYVFGRAVFELNLFVFIDVMLCYFEGLANTVCDVLNCVFIKQPDGEAWGFAQNVFLSKVFLPFQ